MFCDNKCINPDNKKAHCVAFQGPSGEVDLLNQRCEWEDGTEAPPGCCKDLKGNHGCTGQCENVEYRIPDKVIMDDRPRIVQTDQTLDTQATEFIEKSATWYKNTATKIRMKMVPIINGITLQNLAFMIVILSALVISTIFAI